MRTCILLSQKPSFFILLLSLMLSGCSTISGPSPIGNVLVAEGTPSVIRNNRSYLLATEARLYEGDIFNNDSESRFHARMADNAELTLAADSHLVVNRYTADAFAPNARLTLTRGAARFKTGGIAGDRFGTFKIQSPVAIIETRNADFWFGMIFGSNTLDLIMLEGDRVDVENRHGISKLKTPGMGTTVQGRSAPQVPRDWPENKIINALNSTDLSDP